MNSDIVTFIITGREDQGFVKNLYYADNIMNYGNGIVLHEPKYLISILNYVVDTFKFRLIIHLGLTGRQGEHGLQFLNTLRNHLDVEDVVLITREPELFKNSRFWINYKGHKLYNTDEINTKDFVDSLNVFSKAHITFDEKKAITQKESKFQNVNNPTLGNKSQMTITAQTINYFNAEKLTSNQVSNQGKSITSNVSLKNFGNSNDELLKLINFLELNLDNVVPDKIDNEEAKIELERIQVQLRRDSPKYEIINSALNTIHGILTSIAANQYTPIVLAMLDKLVQSTM